MSYGAVLESPFAPYFPLPFRVLFFGGLGILCWATNLHGLHQLGIDPVATLGLRSNQRHDIGTFEGCGLDTSLLYSSVYKVFVSYTVWNTFGWILYRYFGQADPEMVDLFKFIPIVLFLGVLMVLAMPSRHFQKRERDAFLLSLRRCLMPPANEPIHFCDVILADIMTSFAKVIGDVWLSLCMLVPSGSLLTFPTHAGWLRMVLPCLHSLPYVIRLRQCLVEYKQSDNRSKRPLYNALKYASSFPVIYLSAIQRIVVTEVVEPDNNDEQSWQNWHPIYILWLLAVVFNSAYSFWWDVSNDWGLELLKSNSSPTHSRTLSPPKPLVLPLLHSQTASNTDHESFHARHTSWVNGNGKPSPQDTEEPPLRRPTSSRAWGLRPTLFYPLPVYPLAVFFNFILRFTWSLKLSSHLHEYADGAAIIFWIEMAELLRRWVWVYLRVEWEMIKNGEQMRQAEAYELQEEYVEAGVSSRTGSTKLG